MGRSLFKLSRHGTKYSGTPEIVCQCLCSSRNCFLVLFFLNLTYDPGAATEGDFKDLLNELEIMTSVGNHPNLINLIGACSVGGKCVG